MKEKIFHRKNSISKKKLSKNEKLSFIVNSLSNLYTNKNNIMKDILNNFKSKFFDLNINNSTNNNNNNNNNNIEINIQDNGIFFIALISFHQKTGSVIELTFPNKEQIFQNKTNFFSLLKDNNNENESNSSILDYILNKLTFYCLPDGIHLKNKDFNIFFIQKFNRILYCIYYYIQINTNEKNVFDPFQKNERHSIQKSLCIVTLNPFFTYFYENLQIQMEIFMSQSNLENKSMLYDLYNNCINKDDLYKKYKLDDMLIKFFNYSKLFFILKENFFRLIKLILCEKKIIVFSCIPSNCSMFMFSLLSLFPGFLFFNKNYYNNNINEEDILNDNNNNNDNYIEFYNIQKFFLQNGYPFKFLSNRNNFYPIFTLNDLDDIKKNKLDSYIICSSNLLILNLKELNPDCLINLDENKIEFRYNINSINIDEFNDNNENEEDNNNTNEKNKLNDKKNIFNNSSYEKEILNKIFDILKINKKKDNLIYNENLKEDWILFSKIHKNNNNNNNININDNNKFHLYEKIKNNNLFIKNIIYEYFNNLVYDLSFTIEQIFFSKLNFDTTIEEEEQKEEEKQTEENNNNNKNNKKSNNKNSDIYSKILNNLKKFSLDFIFQWTNTKNFKFWFFNHNFSIASLCEYSGKYQNISLCFENGDTYKGTLKSGKKFDKGLFYEFKTKSLYNGYFKNNKKNGKGILQYKNLTSKFTYSGNFVDDCFKGFGNLITEKEKYSGQFNNNEYNGKGILIDKEGNIYDGNFINGLKFGKGKIVKSNGEKIEGIFENNILIEENNEKENKEKLFNW